MVFVSRASKSPVPFSDSLLFASHHPHAGPQAENADRHEHAGDKERWPQMESRGKHKPVALFWVDAHAAWPFAQPIEATGKDLGVDAAEALDEIVAGQGGVAKNNQARFLFSL